MKVAIYGQWYSQDVLSPVETLLDELLGFADRDW